MNGRTTGFFVILCCATVVWLLIGQAAFRYATNRITNVIKQDEMAIKRSDPENYNESYWNYRLSNAVGAEGAFVVFACMFGWVVTVGMGLGIQHQLVKKR